MRQRNVEMVWCWLPNFEQVCEGVHTVTALGNDGMAVNIIVDTEVANSVGEMSDLVQLTYLGKYLAIQRSVEAVGR